MDMNRRAAIKSFLIVSAGVLVIPSCLQENRKASVKLKNIEISGDQQDLLAEIAETIIPATDTPGAKAVTAHLFALKMIDDCYPVTEQQQFTRGLDAFDAMARKQFNQSFTRCTVTQRDILLRQIEAKQNIPSDIAAFYTMMKKLTILGYSSSQYFLTKVQVYELVPARYHGCVPVKPSNKATTL